MAASMESSGQNRAATLMNAARRSHFVSRIEKYEAKVRQAKALIREKEASAMVEQKLPVPNIEGPPLAAPPREQKESIGNQRRAAFNFEEKQCFVPEKKILIPSEKAHPYFQTSTDVEQNCTHRDLPPKQHGDYWLKNSHQYDNSLAWQLHERGYVSLEESRCEHPRGSSPDHRTPTEKKEIISGVLQRSSSSNMPSVVRSINSLDTESGIVAACEKEFPGGFEPLEAHANIYYDFKPAPALEINIAAIAGALKIRIKAADMCAPMQEHAFCSARECLNAVGKLQSKRVAYTLKKEFDQVYGPAWHCIVGTSFGSYVTHSLGGFVYFSLDKVSVLLFKTTVEPIENT